MSFHYNNFVHREAALAMAKVLLEIGYQHISVDPSGPTHAVTAVDSGGRAARISMDGYLRQIADSMDRAFDLKKNG